jgi:ATP-dependent RNA helicase HelY
VVWLGGVRVAVLSIGWRGPERGRVQVIDDQGRARSVSSTDIDEVLHRVGEVELPLPYAPSNKAFQHEVARTLAQARGMRKRSRGGRPPVPSAPQHPVADCPDVDRHLRALVHAGRVRSEVADLDRRITASHGSLTRELDRVLDVLEQRGMVEGWALTARGALLVRVFHECDLLIADCLAAGLLDGLDPPALAAVASCFTYEHRSKVPPPAPWYPSKALRRRVEELLDRAEELRAVEVAAGLPGTRPPDPTFLPLAHAWASGQELDVVLDDEQMSGGDFVRNVRQLIDLLRQLGDAALQPATRRSARSAAEALHRGVVAASVATTVGGSESPDLSAASPTP